jgi:hypothetical protein
VALTPMLRAVGIAAAACVAALPLAATAEAPTADPAIVPLFEETCLRGALDLAGREAVLAGAGWSSADADGMNLKLVDPKPMNFDFAKPDTVRTWKRTVGGREVRAVLATYHGKGRYPLACGIVVPDVHYSWPYWDALGALLKPLGLGGKETDLPHYRAYGGKLTDDRHARAIISSHSALTPGEKNVMHIFIAY